MLFLFSHDFREAVGARHVLRILCHFKTRSRGGVIICERILCSLSTMERRIETFITRNQDAKTYKTLSTGTLPRQDAIAKHDKTPTHAARHQDLQDAFNRHAPLTRRDHKTRQDAYTLDKTPKPARRFQQAHSLDKTR